MVKLAGPMFSLAASGTLAKTITFATWKGRPYVRERVIPSNPKSGAQTGRRAMFAFLAQEWAALTVAEKATWQTIADEIVASPFNAYVRVNMGNWHNFLTPGQQTPILRADAGSDRALTAAVWEENRIKLSSTAASADEQWGIAYFASLTTAFTPSVGTCIICELDLDVAARDTFWTPPTVDTWFFNSIAYSDEGTKETAGGEVNAVPP